jgi:DNA modification methylase
MNNKLIHGDSVKELNKFEDNSVDLLCTDPPYGYGFMGRDWDKVLPDIKIFEECFRVLKPGSMAFVMSAPRSDVQYRMAEMLEKVGFRIDYTPIYWTYASGFPKAMNISKMIDKQKGAKREVTGKGKAGAAFHKGKGVITGGFGNISDGTGTATTEWDEKNNPATDEAKKLDGSYAGFQPKPAVEVVIVAMKPLDKKGYLEQAQDNQKGITWFDDCRIPFEEDDTPQGGYGAMDIGIGKPGETQEYRKKKKITMPDLRDVGKKSKEAIGIDKLSYGQVQNAERLEYEQNTDGRFPANMLVSDKVLDDYSRYFSLDEWFSKNLKSLPEPVQQTFPFMIVPKASRSEKDNGLDRNIHPTVKPLTLMNYLVTLGSRKGDVVLEPFAGSGTTALACVSQERDYIAIEREEEYYDIAKARLEKVEEPIKLWEKFSG